MFSKLERKKYFPCGKWLFLFLLEESSFRELTKHEKVWKLLFKKVVFLKQTKPKLECSDLCTHISLQVGPLYLPLSYYHVFMNYTLASLSNNNCLINYSCKHAEIKCVCLHSCKHFSFIILVIYILLTRFLS